MSERRDGAGKALAHRIRWAGYPCRQAINPKVSQVLASYISGGPTSAIEGGCICRAEQLGHRDLDRLSTDHGVCE